METEPATRWGLERELDAIELTRWLTASPLNQLNPYGRSRSCRREQKLTQNWSSPPGADLFREPPSEFKPIISSLYMRVFENGSLIIYNTQRTDAGYYLCQANNGIGPGISRVIKLTVHGE